MTKITNLPNDMVEEILTRVPLTSLGRIRSTCKKWNISSKDETFTKKRLARAKADSTTSGEFTAIVLLNHKPENYSYEFDISRVCHCDGLVLCTTADFTRLVFWNPYTVQTRCIDPIPAQHRLIYYTHALGYATSGSCRSYKVLRFAHQPGYVFEIYELNSNSRRVLDDGIGDLNVYFHNHGLSLKGNTYWYGEDSESNQHAPVFLVCFDFTTERFGPRLPLPFESRCKDAVFLSSVREEQLAVFYQDCQSCEIEVWVTTKIEPDAVSWSQFLVLSTSGICFDDIGSFLIDEERRAVVVLDKDRYIPTRNVAYIIGENEYHREVNMGEITTDGEGRGFPLACSYVPSSVAINQPAPEP